MTFLTQYDEHCAKLSGELCSLGCTTIYRRFTDTATHRSVCCNSIHSTTSYKVAKNFDCVQITSAWSSSAFTVFMKAYSDQCIQIFLSIHKYQTRALQTKEGALIFHLHWVSNDKHRRTFNNLTFYMDEFTFLRIFFTSNLQQGPYRYHCS